MPSMFLRYVFIILVISFFVLLVVKTRYEIFHLEENRWTTIRSEIDQPALEAIGNQTIATEQDTLKEELVKGDEILSLPNGVEEKWRRIETANQARTTSAMSKRRLVKSKIYTKELPNNEANFPDKDSRNRQFQDINWKMSQGVSVMSSSEQRTRRKTYTRRFYRRYGISRKQLNRMARYSGYYRRAKFHFRELHTRLMTTISSSGSRVTGSDAIVIRKMNRIRMLQRPFVNTKLNSPFLNANSESRQKPSSISPSSVTKANLQGESDSFPEMADFDFRPKAVKETSLDAEPRLRALCFNVTHCHACFIHFRRETLQLLPRRDRLRFLALVRLNRYVGSSVARNSQLPISRVKRFIRHKNKMAEAKEIYFDLLKSLKVALRQRKLNMAFSVLKKIKNNQNTGGKKEFMNRIDSKHQFIADYNQLKRVVDLRLQRFQTIKQPLQDFDQSLNVQHCLPCWYWKRIFNRYPKPSVAYKQAYVPLPASHSEQVPRAASYVKIKLPRIGDDVNRNQLIETYLRLYSLMIAANYTLHDLIAVQKSKFDRLKATLENLKHENEVLNEMTLYDSVAEISTSLFQFTKRGLNFLSTIWEVDGGDADVAVTSGSVECADDSENSTCYQTKIHIAIIKRSTVKFFLLERISYAFQQFKQWLVSWVDRVRNAVYSRVSQLSAFLNNHPNIVADVKQWLIKRFARFIKYLIRSGKVYPPVRLMNLTSSSIDGSSVGNTIVENQTREVTANPGHNETTARHVRDDENNTGSKADKGRSNTDVDKRRDPVANDVFQSRPLASSEVKVVEGKHFDLVVKADAEEKSEIGESKVDTPEESGRLSLMTDIGAKDKTQDKEKSNVVWNSDIVDAIASTSTNNLQNNAENVDDGKKIYMKSKRDEQASRKKFPGFGFPFVKHGLKGGEAHRRNIYLERLVSLWKSKSRTWSQFIWWLALLPHRTISFIRRLELANLRLRMVFFSKFMEDHLGFVGRKVVPSEHKPDAVAQALGKSTQRNAFKLRPERPKNESSLDSEGGSQTQTKEDRRKSMPQLSYLPGEDPLLKGRELDEQINTGDNMTREFLRNNESARTIHYDVPPENESGTHQKNNNKFSIKMALGSNEKLLGARRKRFSFQEGEAIAKLKGRLDALSKLMKKVDYMPVGLPGPRHQNAAQIEKIIIGQMMPKNNEEGKVKENDRKGELGDYLRHKTRPHAARINVEQGSRSQQLVSGEQNIGKVLRNPTHKVEKVGGLSRSGLVKTEGYGRINGAVKKINSNKTIADALRSRLVKLIKVASKKAKLSDKGQSVSFGEDDPRLKMNSLGSLPRNDIQQKLDVLYDEPNANDNSNSESYLNDNEERLLAEARNGQPTEADFNLLENIERLTSKFLGENGEKIEFGDYDSASVKARERDYQKHRVKRSETEAAMEARLNVKPEPVPEIPRLLYLHDDDKTEEFYEKWQNLKPQATKLESEVKKARVKYAEVSDDLQYILQKGDELMAKAEKAKGDDSVQKSIVGTNWDAIKKEFEVFKKEIVAKEDQFLKIKTQVDPDVVSETVAKLKEVVYKLKDAADGELEAGLNLPFSLTSDSDTSESSDLDTPEYSDLQIPEYSLSGKSALGANVKNGTEAYRRQQENELYDPFLDPVESSADIFKDSEDASIESFDYDTKGKFLDESLTDLDSDPGPYETKTEFLEKNDKQELDEVERMLSKLKFRAKLTKDKREVHRGFALKKNGRDSDAGPFLSSFPKSHFDGSRAYQFFKVIKHKQEMPWTDIKYATLSGSKYMADRSLHSHDGSHRRARIKRRAATPKMTTVKPVSIRGDTVEAKVNKRQKYTNTSRYDFNDYGFKVSYDEMDETKPEEGEIPSNMEDTLSDIDGSYLNDDPGDLFSPGSKAVNEADKAASQELKGVVEMDEVGEITRVDENKGVSKMKGVGKLDDYMKKKEVVEFMQPIGQEGELVSIKQPSGYIDDMAMAIRSVDKSLELSGADEQTGQPLGDNWDINTEIDNIVNEREGGNVIEEADEGLKVFDEILRDNMDDYSDLKSPSDIDQDKKGVDKQRMSLENARIKGIDAEVMRQRLNIMEVTAAERLREKLEHEKELKVIDNIDDQQREISESLEELSSMMNIKNKSNNTTASKVSTQFPEIMNTSQALIGLNATRKNGKNETIRNKEQQNMSSADRGEDVDFFSNVSHNQLTTTPRRVSKPITTSPKPVKRERTTEDVASDRIEGKQLRQRESYHDRARDRILEDQASDWRRRKQWRMHESVKNRDNSEGFLDEDKIESPPRAAWSVNYENKLHSKFVKSDAPERYREEALIVVEHKPVATSENKKQILKAPVRKRHSTKRPRSRKRRKADAQQETNDAGVVNRNKLSMEPDSSYSMSEGFSELSPMQWYDTDHNVIWEDNEDDDVNLENSQIWMEETDRKTAEDAKKRQTSSQLDILDKDVFPFADPVKKFKEEIDKEDQLESGDDSRQDGSKTNLFDTGQKDISSKKSLENNSPQIRFQPPIIQQSLTDDQVQAEFHLNKNVELPTSKQLLSNVQNPNINQPPSNDHIFTKSKPGAEGFSKQNVYSKNNPSSMYSKAVDVIEMMSTDNQPIIILDKSQSDIEKKVILISANEDVVTAENSMNLRPIVITKFRETEFKRNSNNENSMMDPSYRNEKIRKPEVEASNVVGDQNGNAASFDSQADSLLALSESKHLATVQLKKSELEKFEDIVKGLGDSRRTIATSKTEIVDNILGNSKITQQSGNFHNRAETADKPVQGVRSDVTGKIPIEAQNIQLASTGQIDEQKSYENSNRLFSSFLELENKIKNPPFSERSETEIFSDADDVMQLEPFEYLPVKSDTTSDGDKEIGDVTDKDGTSEFFKKWNQIENIDLRRLESNVLRQRYEALDDLRKEKLRMKLSQDEDFENDEEIGGLTGAVSDLDDEKFEKLLHNLNLFAEIPVRKKNFVRLSGKRGKPKGSNPGQGTGRKRKKPSHR